MIRKSLAVSCLMILAMTGCAGRVYTETYAERDPLVVHRTVYVDNRRPHYYHRPYATRRVVVANPRRTYGYHGYRHSYRHDSVRRDERPGDRRPDVRTQAEVGTHGGVRIRAEASAN